MALGPCLNISVIMVALRRFVGSLVRPSRTPVARASAIWCSLNSPQTFGLDATAWTNNNNASLRFSVV